MGIINGRGDWIDGQFVLNGNTHLTSSNPANHEPLFHTHTDTHHVQKACDAAHAARTHWRNLGPDDRWAHLLRFKTALESNKTTIAEALSLEIGKLRTEAATEVETLIQRFDLVQDQYKARFNSGALDGFPNEWLTFKPLGVVGVIGPFNFPLHLCHAHVLPALLAGNTVVIKPSEVAPLTAQRYAEAAEAAGLPPGVLNLVQGTGSAGAALLQHPHLRGLCFTGSWKTARRILESTLDRPEVLVALELGGKNSVVVEANADLDQATHEITVGGYLTTGQRCTCTDRIFAHKNIIDALSERLRQQVTGLHMGAQEDPSAFAGPLATPSGHRALEQAKAVAVAAGAILVAQGSAEQGGNFVAPTLHRLPDGTRGIPGYTDHELFGPDLHIQSYDDLDQVIEQLNHGTRGLSHSLFSKDRETFQYMLQHVETAIFNHNRSTNQASPRLPFGGTGTSGNYRPAGSYALRNVVIPVASRLAEPGEFTHHEKLTPISKPTQPPTPRVRIRSVGDRQRRRVLEKISELEARAYEPARRDPPEKLQEIMNEPNLLAQIAEIESTDANGKSSWIFAGYALARPLETVTGRAGPDRDPTLGQHVTLYSSAITVVPEFQGQGIGRQLKRAQIAHARTLQKPDGTPRYKYVSGRNRLSKTKAMQTINLELGAKELCRIQGAYGTPESIALYYQIPLR